MIRLITVCLLVAVAYSTPEVLAQSSQSKTANLKVSATVVANCIVTTTDVNFGNYDPVGTNATAPLDADGSVTLACTRGTVALVGMNYGSNASGVIRRMANGTSFLTYDLYLNSQRSIRWVSPLIFFPGNQASSTAPRTLPVHGRIPQGQDVPVGAFADTVLVVATF